MVLTFNHAFALLFMAPSTSNQGVSVAETQFFLLDHLHAKPGSQRILCLRVIKERDPRFWVEPPHLIQRTSGNNRAGACWIEHALTASGVSGTICKCFYIRSS